MKTKIENYTFDASAKTITFGDYVNIRLDAVLLITNVTDNIIIYNFADATKGGTVATNVLTLTYDTTSMADADKLLIYYDDVGVSQSVDTGLTGLATTAKQDDIITAIGAIPGGGGTQYTEGDVDASITGTAIMFRNGTTNIVPVGPSEPLPISGTVGLDLTGTDFASQSTLAVIDTNINSVDTRLNSIDSKTPALGQALAADSTPVVLTAAQITTLTPPAAITGFATEATLGSVKTAVETIDNAIAGTEMQVDIVSAPTLTVNAHAVTNAGTFAVQVDGNALTSLQLIDDSIYTDGAGTVTKGVAILGQDGTNPQAIKTDAAGELQVDVLSLPAVTATDLDIRNLTNTDVVTAELSAVDNAVLDTIAAKDFATQTTLAAINTKLVTGTDIGDVTINNSTGAAAVNIQDGGNTITVDGTVTANATLAAETTKVIGTVNIAASQTVGLAAGTAGIGKLTANSGVDIGDVDVTSLPALAAGTNAIGKLLPSDIDVTAHTNYARKYYTNAGAVTDGIIWSPAAGKRWHVVTMYIQTSAAATITLEDDKAGGDDPVWKGELAANSGAVLSFTEKYPMASGEDAADLLITTTAGNVYCTVVGYEI